MNNSKKTKAQLIAEVEELQGGGLRTILETIPHGVVETDRKGRVTYGNSACYKLFGVAEGELTGAAIFDRLESRAERQSLRRCLVNLVSEQPEPSPYHTTTRTKDGRSLELRVDWNYKRDHGGKLTGFVAALTDITEQKRNEEELRASQRLLQTVVDTFPHNLAVRDREGRMLLVNNTWERFFGCSREDAVGKRLTEVPTIKQEHALMALKDDQDVLSGREKLSVVEQPRIDSQENDRLLQFVKAPLLDENEDIVGVVAVATDITEQKRDEEELRASRTLLQTMFDTMPVGVYVKDRERRYVMYNRAHARRYGVDSEAIKGRTAEEVSQWASSEVQLVLEEDRQVLEEGKFIDIPERSIVRPDGSVQWHRIFRAPLHNEDGDITGLMAIREDITDRKQAEEELRASQGLLQTVFDTMPVGMFVKDADGKFLMVNDTFCEYFGLTPDEFLALPPEKMLASTEDERAQTRSEDEKVIKTGRRLDIPEKTTTYAGKTIWWHVTKSPLRDNSGKVVGIVGSRLDITERKRAEDEARLNRMQLEEAVEAISEGFLLFDAEERLVLCNSAFRSLYSEISHQLVPGIHFEDWARICVNTGQIPDAVGREESWIAQRLEDFRNPKGYKDYLIKENRWSRVSEYKTPSGYFAGLRIDITDQKQAEEELRASQRLLQTVFDAIPIGVCLKDPKGRYQMVNKAFAEYVGQSPEAMLKRVSREIGVGTDEEIGVVEASDRRIVETGEWLDTPEETFTFPNGEVRWRRTIKGPIHADDGNIVGIIGVREDITERKRAEEELRESEGRFRAIIDNSPSMIVLKNLEGRYSLVNRRFMEWFGVSEAEVLNKTIHDIFPEEFAGRYTSHDQEVLKSGTVIEREIEVPLPDGTPRTIISTKFPVMGPNRQIIGIGGIAIDITERKRAEEELRESQQLFEAIFNTFPHWVFVKDLENRYLMVNSTFANTYGRSPEEFVNKTARELSIGTKPQQLVFREMDRKVLETESLVEFPEVEVTFPDGQKRIQHTFKLPLRDDEGTITGIVAVTEDITERKQAEEELRVSQRLLQTVFDTIPIGVFVKDAQGVFQMVNRAFCEHRDLSPEEFLSLPGREMFVGTDEEKDRTRREDRQVMESGARLEIFEKPDTLGDKEYCWHVLKSPLLDESGKAVGVVGVREDVTGRKQVEERLRQAQKMEAVGQLAGGVAHEFNNLLHMIMGFTEIALESTPAGDSRHNNLTTIQQATERGAALVRQLLGYSRRQILRPSVLDVNELMSSLSNMVTATIGRRIPVVFNPGRDIKPIYADAGSIEQVLLNLAINARDAMPSGGSLTLETRNLSLDEEFCGKHPEASPGDYVRISVTDTGEGMNEDLLERIFEPFFTTKGPQEGSGLGLAMVQGLVNQHGGLVDVSSQPGAGTTFDLYLPVHGNGAINGAADAGGRAGGNTILVAEDERDVQELSAALLEREGYAVLRASDGQEAKEVFERNAAEIDLVLLDMVMPKADGREVYEHIRKLRPEMPVIFHSAFELGKSDSDFLARQKLRLLRKPYTSHQLRNAVNELLKFSKLS